MLFTPSKTLAVVVAAAGSLTKFHVKITSEDVNAVPSDHLMFGLSFHVTVVKSLEMPPLATVGTSEASIATGVVPFGPMAASGSMTSRDPSKSLVPWFRCGLRRVTACQYRILRSPPAPRVDATVVADAPGVGLAAGVGVHAVIARIAVIARASPRSE